MVPHRLQHICPLMHAGEHGVVGPMIPVIIGHSNDGQFSDGGEEGGLGGWGLSCGGGALAPG